MRRGEIWTIAGGGGYANKPRPAVIVQDDAFDNTDSITVCGLTSTEITGPLFRLRIEPNEVNGLLMSCYLMVDKIASIRRSRLRMQIGRLEDHDITRLNRAVLVFLGLASRADRASS